MNVVLGMALLLLIAVFSIITSKEKGNRRKKGARMDPPVEPGKRAGSFRNG